MSKNHTLVALTLIGSAIAPLALAQQRPVSTVSAAGFYGGVALRDAGADSAGISLGHLASTWGRFASPVADDSARRAMLFGGYRFANDVALEGAVSSAESYALRPFDAGARRGVGLSLVGSPDVASHTFNADVFTTWSFRKAFSLYGRLGYAQTDAVSSYALASLPPSDPRRLRDGVNYGVGVRYDVTSALGLRLEYARFPRFAGEAVSGSLPESDQVQFGMQFKF